MTVIKVKAKNGLHARPASLIVSEASKFKSEVFIESNGKQYNCKSIMAIMSSQIKFGDEVVISALGEDSAKAEEKVFEIIEGLTE